MAQTEGRYPVINKEAAVSSARTIWELRDHIDFLKDFDPRKAVQMTQPPSKLSHKQHQLLIGRAAKVVYATLGAGTWEEVERAVKFFLVMIDAEKHLLDVDEAKEKYGFKELEDKYVRGVKSE